MIQRIFNKKLAGGRCKVSKPKFTFGYSLVISSKISDALIFFTVVIGLVIYDCITPKIYLFIRPKK